MYMTSLRAMYKYSCTHSVLLVAIKDDEPAGTLCMTNVIHVDHISVIVVCTCACCMYFTFLSKLILTSKPLTIVTHKMNKIFR